MWGPQMIAMSWFVTSIDMVYDTKIPVGNGETKPTYNRGGSHCMFIVAR